jgi:hypothetical protein
VLTLVFIIATKQPRLLLRLGGFLVLGVCATSQLHVEFLSEDPLLVVRSDDTFMRHWSCNGYNTLFYTLELYLVFTKSILDPGAHVIYASSFAFKTGCDR